MSPAKSLSRKSALKRVDWRLLECFRVAGLHQHITKAAEELGTSQPALSRSLRRLELEIGIPLFQRVGRSVCLTRYGRSFLNHVEHALHTIEDGRQELEDIRNPGRGTVSIGFLRSLGAEYVPDIVRQFRARYPDVRFNFTSCNSLELSEKLESGELDLVFLSEPIGKHPFSWRRLKDQELFLIVSNEHRLAHKKEVALREVADEPFVTFKSGHAVRNLTEELCRQAGFTPTVVLEGDDSAVMRGFVSAGFGVAVTPPENGSGRGVSALRITEPVAYRTIGIAWRKDRYLPASVKLFRDFTSSLATAKARSRKGTDPLDALPLTA